MWSFGSMRSRSRRRRCRGTWDVSLYYPAPRYSQQTRHHFCANFLSSNISDQLLWTEVLLQIVDLPAPKYDQDRHCYEAEDKQPLLRALCKFHAYQNAFQSRVDTVRWMKAAQLKLVSILVVSSIFCSCSRMSCTFLLRLFSWISRYRSAAHNLVLNTHMPRKLSPPS